MRIPDNKTIFRHTIHFTCPEGHEFTWRRFEIVGTLSEAIAYRERLSKHPHHFECHGCKRFYVPSQYGMRLEQLKDE